MCFRGCQCNSELKESEQTNKDVYTEKCPLFY